MSKSCSKSCAKGSCALPKSFFPVKFRVRSALEALQLARKLIRPFKHWTTGNLAIETIKYKDEEGVEVVKKEVSPKSPQAEAFCALGALNRVNSRYEDRAMAFLMQAGAKMSRDAQDVREFGASEEDIFEVNDGSGDKHNHQQVLKMFQKAIVMARRAQKSRKR